MPDTEQIVALNACTESWAQQPLDAATDSLLWLGYEAAHPTAWMSEPLGDETQASL
ncbi:hypothetical protein [Piscinibacter sakaiensis]|uniref:hypothetical protein n=1 Tax=Piscinibacter sakaiensis TaxID=1547922 RepID=UPI003AAD3439